MPHLLSLSGQDWRFRQRLSKNRNSVWRPAQVPGCVHRDLLRNGLIDDPFFGTNELRQQWIEEADWEYRLRFRVGSRLLEQERIELVIDGLDTLATVLLNGRRVGSSENMFESFRWDVRGRLRTGMNELVVRFDNAMDYILSRRLEHQPPRDFNDPVGGCTRIRKQGCQFGWDWGPRLVTAGIWRDLRIEAWSGARLSGVHIRQQHHGDGSVSLDINPEIDATPSAGRYETHVSVFYEDHEIGRATSAGAPARIDLRKPRLWWPAGQGEQPLHRVRVELVDAETGVVVDRLERRIGLRTIVLERKPDQWGESFAFVVNGRPVFAKGANWVPVHAFVGGLERPDYERDLRAAVAANMNMIRLWGGGVYEHEAFYDLCDELGLMIWHDFMFACTLYPCDDSFAELVRREVRCQIPRIRHHASLALWCGNNEISQINGEALRAPAIRAGYERLFHAIIPEALSELDPDTSYWPTSEWRGDFHSVMSDGEKRGDTHFWEVWHSRKPVSEYEKYALRFCSEFGMQSYVSPETAREICPPGDRNLFGATMENHQKNTLGNQIILDYVTRRYGCPRDQDALMILSQLNQAYCMRVAVEHYRRLMPRCMGALYWQINDNWPVASWSSIEHNGRWKALHHEARRFFAPSIVSAEVEGLETQGTGNYRASTVRRVHLHTIHDGPRRVRAELGWELRLEGGRVLDFGHRLVSLRPCEGRRQLTLDLASAITEHGRDRLVLRVFLDIHGQRVSDDSVFLTHPRFVALPEPALKVGARRSGRGRAVLRFESPVYQHRFSFTIPGLTASSDNHFELWPGEAREVSVELAGDMTGAQLREALRWTSYARLRA